MTPSPLPKRRRPHHEVVPVSHRPTLVFVTVCTKDRLQVLASTTAHRTLVEAWKGTTAWLVGRYVVMPDHVHLFVAPGQDPVELGKWVSFWKRQVARTLGTGIWQEGYWDRTLRDGESYAQKWAYVRDNPVRHGMVNAAIDWPFAGVINELNW